VDTQPRPNPDPDPKEVRKIHDESVRIMSITMLHALKQMVACTNAHLISHDRSFITPAEAAPCIMHTKRFWLRNTNCMSDYREVQHGFDIFNRYFHAAKRRRSRCVRPVHQSRDDVFAATTGGRTPTEYWLVGAVGSNPS
jgi:hypothetical protein